MIRREAMKTLLTAAIGLLAMLAIAACGDDDSGDEATPTPGDGRTADSSGLPQGGEPFELDPADFTTDIDNPYWPMEPGTRWTYREIDEEGTELEVIVTVTTVTKEVANGITARVVRDTVYEDGELIEDTLDWYAQDAEGNIWYLGEDTVEFEDGELTTIAGAWEAGVDGALAGVIMPANPAVGMTYRQEYYEGEAEDNGEILSLGESVDVPAGQYEGCVQTADTSGIEPDVLEHKYYAEGVGPVLTIDVEGGGREELLSVEQVSAEAAEAAGTTPLGQEYP
jgi:hypothetical protein